MTLVDPQRKIFKLVFTEGLIDHNEGEKPVMYSSADLYTEIMGTGYCLKTLIDSPQLSDEIIGEVAKDLVLTALSQANEPLPVAHCTGVSPHDCCAYYKCPNCGEIFDDWAVKGGKYRCRKCFQLCKTE